MYSIQVTLLIADFIYHLFYLKMTSLTTVNQKRIRNVAFINDISKVVTGKVFISIAVVSAVAGKKI